MTSMEAYGVLTETGAGRGEDDFVSLLAPSCNQCYYASSQAVRKMRGLQYIGAGLQYIGAPKFYFQDSGKE